MEMESGRGKTTEPMSPASVSGDGITSKHAMSEEEVAGDGAVTSKRAESSSEVSGDGATTSKRPSETDIEAAAGSGKTKRTKLIKYPKEIAEFVLRQGRPSLPPPARRPTATQLEIAADAQKEIDRYDQIWEQYMEKGEAEIEVTDEEEEAAAKVVDLDERFPPGSLWELGDKMVTVEEFLEFMWTPASA